MWLAKVKETYGDDLQVDWKPFLLAQINKKEGPDWKAWEQAEGSSDLGLLAMRAGEAAKRQGYKAFEAFQLILLKARHEQRKDLSDSSVIMDAVKMGGLDVERFQQDLADEGILQELGESHTRAVEEHGVFGVPTFVARNGASAFLKTYVPPDEEALEAFETITKLLSNLKYLGEMKRPQPPWPKGVFT